MHPIYIEVSDEITTVIERLKAAPGKSVALVIPKGAILLQSIVNLKLAKKAAADAGKKVTLVTTDKIGRNLATQVGLSVLSHLDSKANEAAEDPADTEEGSEPHVIDGVKVHRYYEENEKDEEEESTPIEPIIPKAIFKQTQEDESPEATAEGDKPETAAASSQDALEKEELGQEDSLPLTVREIKTEPAKAKKKSESSTDSEKSEKKEGEPSPVLVETAAASEKTTEKINTSTVDMRKKKENTKADFSQFTRKLHQLPPFLQSRRKGILLGVYLAFLLILVAVGIGAFHLPRTTATLVIKPQPWSNEFQTTARADVTATTEDGQTIPLEVLQGEVTDKLSFKATGDKDVGEKAHGTALILNGYSSSPQNLAAGAKLSANGLIFITETAVTVPGAKVEAGKPVAGSVSVGIVAEKNGPDSNMKGVTGTIVSPPSNLYTQITETTGGTDKHIAIITQNDISNAKNTLTKKLQDASKEKLAEIAKNSTSLFKETNDTFILDNFTTTVLAGTEAENGEVSAKGTTKRFAVSQETLRQAMEKRALAAKDAKVNLTFDSVEVQSFDYNAADLVATVKAKLTGKTTPVVNKEELRRALVKQKRESGIKFLQEKVPGSQVEISQSPTWWPIKNFPYSLRFIEIKERYE